MRSIIIILALLAAILLAANCQAKAYTPIELSQLKGGSYVGEEPTNRSNMTTLNINASVEIEGTVESNGNTSLNINGAEIAEEIEEKLREDQKINNVTIVINVTIRDVAGNDVAMNISGVNNLNINEINANDDVNARQIAAQNINIGSIETV